jgi:outer membrane protein OmpA-like peptidoglycan-associated protein
MCLACHLRLRARTAFAVGTTLGCALCGCTAPTVFAGRQRIVITGTAVPAALPTAKVELKGDRIEIEERIQFDHNAATIKPVSHGLLDEVANLLRAHPELRKVSIEAYASGEGDDAYNLDVSDRRSRAVMDHLVGKGVAKERLVARGWGEQRPISEHESDAGRAKSHRVEFNVVDRDAPAATAAGASL